MGRKKGSYKFEKRQKELKKKKKKKKKREKLERRQNRGNGFDDEPQPSVELDHLLVEPADTDPETDSESDSEN